MTNASAEAHVELVRRMSEAIDAGDEAACRSLFAADIEYVFVSQGTHCGTDAVIEATLAEGRQFQMDRDLYTADGSGRVWWRFAAHWTDAVTGRPRRTTGASVAHIQDGRVQSVMSWVDVTAAARDADV